MSSHSDTDAASSVHAQLTRTPHPRYKEARSKAHQLETTIETAQKQYAAQLSTIIRKLQQQFYSKYGDKIQELEDLEEAIGNIQYSGMKNLKRQLTRMYLMSDGNHQQGGGETAGKKEMQEIARQLYTQYKQQYFPKDEYQKKRDAEAHKLQMAIMGSMGGGGNIRVIGGGGVPSGIAMQNAMLTNNRAPPHMLGVDGYSSDDESNMGSADLDF